MNYVSDLSSEFEKRMGKVLSKYGIKKRKFNDIAIILEERYERREILSGELSEIFDKIAKEINAFVSEGKSHEERARRAEILEEYEFMGNMREVFHEIIGRDEIKASRGTNKPPKKRRLFRKKEPTFKPADFKEHEKEKKKSEVRSCRDVIRDIIYRIGESGRIK